MNAIDNRGLGQPYACHVAIIAFNLIKVNLKVYSEYSTEFIQIPISDSVIRCHDRASPSAQHNVQKRKGKS